MTSYPKDAGASAYSGANPYAPASTGMPSSDVSPGLAFLLGLIPGVGAIYNGQYLKGLVHAGIFGLLISVVNSAGGGQSEVLVSMVLAAFYFYMPFEAYHTAKKRRLGMPVEEWSSFMSRGTYRSRAPVGPIVLIVIGVVFLLDSLHLLDFDQIGRFWPLLLIAAGVYLLYARLTGPADSVAPRSTPEATGIAEDRHE